MYPCRAVRKPFGFQGAFRGSAFAPPFASARRAARPRRQVVASATIGQLGARSFFTHEHRWVMIKGPCASVHVRRSMYEGPCMKVHVWRSMYGAPCAVFHVWWPM
eukprot:10387351-Lingulodinium_polyedra.AAC.1